MQSKLTFSSFAIKEKSDLSEIITEKYFPNVFDFFLKSITTSSILPFKTLTYFDDFGQIIKIPFKHYSTDYITSGQRAILDNRVKSY